MRAAVEWSPVSEHIKEERTQKPEAGSSGSLAAPRSLSGAGRRGGRSADSVVELSWLPGLRSRPLLRRGAPGRRQPGAGPAREETRGSGRLLAKAPRVPLFVGDGVSRGAAGGRGDSASSAVKDPMKTTCSAGNCFTKTQNRRF